jgi:hypothetical protein
VSQAGPMMGGMPPGAGTAGPGGPMPNAHALSHLNPTQAHMFQQQAFQQNCEYFSLPVVPEAVVNARGDVSISGPSGNHHRRHNHLEGSC